MVWSDSTPQLSSNERTASAPGTTAVVQALTRMSVHSREKARTLESLDAFACWRAEHDHFRLDDIGPECVHVAPFWRCRKIVEGVYVQIKLSIG